MICAPSFDMGPFETDHCFFETPELREVDGVAARAAADDFAAELVQ